MNEIEDILNDLVKAGAIESFEYNEMGILMEFLNGTCVNFYVTSDECNNPHIDIERTR